MTVQEQVAIAAAVISVIVLVVNARVALLANRRTLRMTDETNRRTLAMAEEALRQRAAFEVDRVLEQRRHDREMPRLDAKVEIVKDLKALQRHSGENWFVLRTMLDRIVPPNGTPFVQHFRKLEYPSDLKSFQPTSEHLFDDPMLAHVQKIRLMIRNCNIEVAEAIDVAKTRDAAEVSKVVADLLVKAGVMYTLWTAGMPELVDATDWDHHGAIEASRYREIRDRAPPAVTATLKQVDEPFAPKPLTMYNATKPGRGPVRD